MSTTTIYRCSDCNHQSADHTKSGWLDGRPRKGPCSLGGCACRLTVREVEEREEPHGETVYPGYDKASGTWTPFHPAVGAS